MESSTSSTTNLQNTQPYVSNPNVGESVQPAPAAAPTPATVDVTGASEPAAEKETPKAGFDSDSKHISASYFQKNMANLGKGVQYIANQNQDEYYLQNSVSDTSKLKNSFALQYKKIGETRNDYSKQKTEIDDLQTKFPDWTFMPATHLGTVICYNSTTGKTCTAEELQSLPA